MADGAGTNADTSGQGGDGTQAGGEGQGNWYDSLPEGLKDNPNIMKYGSIEDLAQGHVNATQLIGRDRIPMPKTDAEYREVYAKLGMPDKADKYELPDADFGIDPSLYSPEEAAADKVWWKEQAHALGLSTKQASKAYEAFMTRQGAGSKAISQKIDGEVMRAEAMLRAEWGESYEGNITVANRGMAKLFGAEATQAIVASGLGRNPAFVRGMYRFGMSALEDLGIDKRGNAARTPAQLAEEIAELQGNPAYFDNAHPEHEAVVERVFALQKRLHPESA